MTAPTSQFRRLSIGDNTMAETGSQAGGTSHSPETIQANSGITYSLAYLDTDSEARARIGLTSEFDVISCCTTRTGYDFNFSERPQVHIESNAYTCTCSTFSSHPEVACQHIFWILDRLHGYFVPQPPASDVPLSNNGHSPNLPRIEQLLDGKLETIAEELSWHYFSFEAEERMNRVQKVRDIMSAFSTVTLPEDFRLDLEESLEQPRTPEQCVVQGDFEATMFRLAIHDDFIYSSLYKAMPSGASAAIYFDKMQGKSRKILADFDRYCQTGQGTPVQVDDVINQLQENVRRIQANIFARTPHGMDGAARALITLLEDICNRNKDPLDGNKWGRRSLQGEDEDQRNLYHQLIGKAEETGEFFILDTLEFLPPVNLYQVRDTMRAILHRNEVNRAPKAYILMLNDLVRFAESTSDASGQKRPAAATSGGNQKRTR